MPFQDLSSLLNRNIQRKGLRYQVEAAMALEYFNVIVDQFWSGRMKDRARPLYLKDQVLTIAVVSPVLGQELRQREGEIIDYINQKIGAEAVGRLRYIS